MTQTEIQTEVQDQFQAETQADIPAAHQAAVQRAIEIALYAAQHDRTLRVPRSDEDRANGFADWLARKRRQHEPMMQAAVTGAFANGADLNEMTHQKYVDCCVWPAIELWLHHHWALRAQASWWVSYHYGGRITIGMPEPQGDMWRIPLGVYQYGDDFGQVMLDRDGNVIEHLTSTPDELTGKSCAIRLERNSKEASHVS